MGMLNENIRFTILVIMALVSISVLVIINIPIISETINYKSQIIPEDTQEIIINDDTCNEPDYWFYFPDYPDRHLTMKKGTSLTIPVSVYNLEDKDTFDVDIIVLSRNVTDASDVIYKDGVISNAKLLPDGINIYTNINRLTIEPYTTLDDRELKPVANFTLSIDISNDVKPGVYLIDLVGHVYISDICGGVIDGSILYITIK